MNFEQCEVWQCVIRDLFKDAGGYYNKVHLGLKMIWWYYASARARCTFAVSILLLLDASFINCNSSARALATILESCKFPRTIAELLSSLILYSTVCAFFYDYDAFLQEFGIYAKKSKDFWQPVHTLLYLSLPLFSGKFKNTNEVICSHKKKSQGGASCMTV